MEEFAEDPELKLRFFIGDTPERHYVRGLVSHSGKNSCEVCVGVAQTGPIHWPYSTSHGKRERTPEEMEHAAKYVLLICK